MEVQHGRESAASRVIIGIWRRDSSYKSAESLATQTSFGELRVLVIENDGCWRSKEPTDRHIVCTCGDFGNAKNIDIV